MNALDSVVVSSSSNRKEAYSTEEVKIIEAPKPMQAALPLSYKDRIDLEIA